MTWPLRIEFPGALHWVRATAVGYRSIATDEGDRQRFIDYLGACVERFEWKLFTYTLLRDHVQLLVDGREQLGRGMHWLLGSYAAWFNRSHQRVGYFFHRRYEATLVEKETCFRELVRDIALEAVRSKIVKRPEEHRWSGHRAIAGDAPPPPWLAVNDTRSEFSNDPAAYASFVEEAIGAPRRFVFGDPYIGTDVWKESIRREVERRSPSDGHPLRYRRVGRAGMPRIRAAIAGTLGIDVRDVCRLRGSDSRMMLAWLGVHEGMLNATEVAVAMGIHSANVTRLLRRCDEEMKTRPALRSRIDQCVATLRRTNAK